MISKYSRTNKNAAITLNMNHVVIVILSLVWNKVEKNWLLLKILSKVVQKYFVWSQVMSSIIL